MSVLNGERLTVRTRYGSGGGICSDVIIVMYSSTFNVLHPSQTHNCTSSNGFIESGQNVSV